MHAKRQLYCRSITRMCTYARTWWPYTGYTVNTQREHAARWQHMLRAGALAPVLRPGRGGSDQTLGSITYPPGPALLCVSAA